MRNYLYVLLTFCTFNVWAQPAGSLDVDFGIGGKVTTVLQNSSKAYGVAIQSDQKIVVCGYQYSPLLGKDLVCIRYKTDGSLDSTFGANGVSVVDAQLGSDDEGRALSIQSNGYIVVAGFTDNGVNKDAFICRLKTDGTLDSTFGNTGKVIMDFDSLRQDEIHALQVHALTGKIIVAGNSIISNIKAKPVVARFLADGTPDSTFNNTGIRTLWVTPLDYQYYFSAEDLWVYPNGKIAVGGWRDFPSQQWYADNWVAMINSNGSMDNTFSLDGVNMYNGNFNGNDKSYSMLPNSNGNLVLAGGSYLNTTYYDALFFEITTVGNTTGLAGTVSTGNLNNDIAYSIRQDIANNYYIAGSGGTATTKSFLLSKFSATGVLDNTFGNAGLVTTTFGSNLLNEALDMQLQADGKIVAVGYSGNDIALARYLGESVAQLNSFQLTAPANNAINQFYTYIVCDFTDAFLATSYQVEIDTFSNFTTAQTYNVVFSSAGISNLLPSKTYYWRARASDGTNWGNWTSEFNFTTKSPDTSTAVFSQEIQKNIQLYPNPVKSILNIESAKHCKGTIYNSAGKPLLEIACKEGKNWIELSFLPAGLYYFQLDAHKGSISFLKE